MELHLELAGGVLLSWLRASCEGEQGLEGWVWVAASSRGLVAHWFGERQARQRALRLALQRNTRAREDKLTKRGFVCEFSKPYDKVYVDIQQRN
jgi:hypothetical protein